MDMEYEKYIIEQYKEAEKIATKVGYANNNTVDTIFKMITQPYYYWNKK